MTRLQRMTMAVAGCAIAAALAMTTLAAQSREGITVHGDWTIVIRNDDGSVASRHEFRNALRIDGALVLAELMGRGSMVGGWAIALSNPSLGGQPCAIPTAGEVGCILSERAVDPVGSTFVDRTVSLTARPNPNNSVQFLLSGTRRATNTGKIGRVETYVTLCGITQPNCTPSGASLYTFSGTDISGANAIPVAANQTIDVSVVFSFQ